MIASFHLIRYPPGQVRFGLSKMAFDRPALARTRGLRFWRLLGTGRGAAMSLGADLSRWALFAVWQDAATLTAFLADSPVTEGWRRAGAETWTVRLAWAGGHGLWGSTNPFAGMTPVPLDPERPVAVLTRAAIRPLRLTRFYRAVPDVDRDLARAAGCMRAVGIGEWPVARQATFSVWRDLGAVRGFAYGPGPHRAVISRTRAENWYSQECFARFMPYGSAGSWDGADPLAASQYPAPGQTAGHPPSGRRSRDHHG
jgi:hypothetical protein